MKKPARRIDFVLVLLAVALLTAWQVTRQPFSPRPANVPVGTPCPANALIGTWQGPKMEVTFQADGTLELTFKEHNYGSKTGTYRVDFSQRPAQLDIRFDNTRFHETTHFLSCEITSRGALRLSEEPMAAKRPRTFGQDTIVLYRQPRGAGPSST